jgi:RNA-directed DNA polymerase
MEQPRTRQELYEYVRQHGGRDSFVAEQMIRLGFWKSSELPSDPVEEIKRIQDLQLELEKVRAENRKLFNEKALLKELRLRRLAESRQKQKETKERRERERRERAEAWQKQKETEIVYLGEKVSGGLNYFEEKSERLEGSNLPSFPNIEELARAMNLTVGKLRFLAFHRATSETTHYIHFKLPKKTGGHRLISAPMPQLKAAQHWILENILQKVVVHDAAHGFLKEKNIVSNARPHVGAKIVVNFDLEDFFPSIDFRRVKGIFRSLGYSEATATIFALICTAPETEEVEIDGKTYFVAVGERHLPQGAPTSPFLTNILCKRLDKGLTTFARNHGFAYTRYADDLTFSTRSDGDNLRDFINKVRYIVTKQGLTINESKTRVLRRGRQQEVTGIVVNDKISIDRKTLRAFRACLHRAETKGLEGLRWGNSPDVIAALDGFANFVLMVDAEKGKLYKEQVGRIAAKYGWKSGSTRKFTPQEIRETIDKKDEKPADDQGKEWWKVF